MNASRFAILAGSFVLLLSGCSGGGGDDAAATDAYRQFHQALEKQDVAAMKHWLTADKGRELDTPEARTMLPMVKQMSPDEASVTAASVEGTNATLTLEGKLDGKIATGKARMIKEGAQWKVADIQWHLDMGTLAMDAGGPATIVSLLKDPKQPPKPALTLNASPESVSDLAFTRDGRWLVSASYDDYMLKVWDAGAGTEKSAMKLPNRPTCLRLTPDNQVAVVGDAYGAVTLWSLDDGTIGQPKILVAEKQAGAPGIHSTLAVSPDGALIAATGNDASVSIWKLSNSAMTRELKEVSAPKLAFSPSGKLLAGAKGNTLVLWEVGSWKAKSYTLAKVDQAAGVGGIHFSPDSRLVVVGLMDSSIVVFDAESRKEAHNFAVSQTSVWDVKFSPCGGFFAAAQHNKMIALFDTRTAKRVARLTEHKGEVRSLAFSPDGSTLASAAAEPRIVLWRTPQGR